LADGFRPHPFASGVDGPDGFVLLESWCPDQLPAAATAPPPVAALRAEVTRLLPRLAIGMAPPGGATLVNIRTLFWVDTPAVRDLGGARLVGLPVALRARFVRARVKFGDGDFGVMTSPDLSPVGLRCGECLDLFGHRYLGRGVVTVRCVVTWSAEFSVAGQWYPIPGEVDGPETTATLSVKEAHAVLISPP
jgi:hypothetical protein